MRWQSQITMHPIIPHVIAQHHVFHRQFPMNTTYKGFSFPLPLAAAPPSSFLPALPPKSMYMRPYTHSATQISHSITRATARKAT